MSVACWLLNSNWWSEVCKYCSSIIKRQDSNIFEQTVTNAIGRSIVRFITGVS